MQENCTEECREEICVICRDSIAEDNNKLVACDWQHEYHLSCFNLWAKKLLCFQIMPTCLLCQETINLEHLKLNNSVKINVATYITINHLEKHLKLIYRHTTDLSYRELISSFYAFLCDNKQLLFKIVREDITIMHANEILKNLQNFEKLNNIVRKNFSNIVARICMIKRIEHSDKEHSILDLNITLLLSIASLLYHKLF